MFCWSDYDLSVFYCIFGGGGERHIWMVPCADTATVTISEASIETATLHYGIGKANNRNDKIERWTRRRTPHFPSLIGRRPNGFLGLSLYDRTILLPLVLLDKTVSVGKDSLSIKTLA